MKKNRSQISPKVKQRNILCRTLPPHLVCQISGWYIYFRQIFSPESVSVDDAIFRTAIWSISRHRTEIKMTFLESWDQICWETRIFYSKIAIQKFELIWPEVDLILFCRWLASGQIKNGFDFWILHAKVTVNHVLHARKKIFWFWWSFVTWPWPVLSMTRVLTGYLH